MKKTVLPKMLSFSAPDLREQIEALPEGTALIGISTTGQAIAVDLDAEAPHVLVCTGAGGGSTTMLRTLTAQFLHQGAHALVLDPKRISHLWAKTLPTVTHRGNIAGIHDALTGLATELQRRLRLDGDLTGVPRLIVAMDEADATVRQLARYWKTFRRNDEPRTSPAVIALEEAIWAGREARIHVILDGRANRILAGTSAREQFATVILSRVTTDTWRRLAPIAVPAPKQSRHPGRFHVIQHDRPVHETQAVVMTDAEVVDWLTDPDNNQS
ncbi:hypothetical protein [Streptomyces uncialis]|uniref:hypothetical protein n=1 Tax=Streptomyces uncialis TaxID=1048205 RepID=UPI00386BBC1D|nr:hypothetical protein OG924_37020 [Streptomyces uncialis]